MVNLFFELNVSGYELDVIYTNSMTPKREYHKKGLGVDSFISGVVNLCERVGEALRVLSDPEFI